MPAAIAICALYHVQGFLPNQSQNKAENHMTLRLFCTVFGQNGYKNCSLLPSVLNKFSCSKVQIPYLRKQQTYIEVLCSYITLSKGVLSLLEVV